MVLWCFALTISQAAATSSNVVEITIIDVDARSAQTSSVRLSALLARDKSIGSPSHTISVVAVSLVAPIGPQLDAMKNRAPKIFYLATPLLVPHVRKAFVNTPIVVTGVVDARQSDRQEPLFREDKMVTGYLFQQTPLAKRVSHLARLCTGITKIGYITTREAKKTPKFDEFIAQERVSLHKLGITLDVIFVDQLSEIGALPDLVRSKRIDALDIVYTQFATDNFSSLLTSVKQAALPYVFSLPQAVIRGAAFSVYTAMDAKDAKIAKIIAGLIKGEPVHSFPVEIQTSQTIAVRYSEFSKIKSCDADRAIRLATVRLE